MAERSILAYFKSPDQAQKALEQLQQLHLVEAAIDRFDGMAGSGVDRITNPATGNFGSLAELTLSGDVEERDAGVLAAATVSASGFSSGGPENRVSGRDILLTAVVEEKDFERAMQIVKQAGAL
jgi:hypothetical protein